jgi:uncharacterized lipoprotein YajG
MKTKQFISGLALIVSVAFLASCAQTVKFQNSSVVPAAQGNVKVKQDDNNNYRISVNIKDLADIERLDPSKKPMWYGWKQDREIPKT